MSSAEYISRDSNHALEAIEREITASKSFRRFAADYGAVVILLVCYLPFWRSTQLSGLLPLMVVLLSLHAVAEVRAQQRQKLLLDALRDLQRLVVNEATPDA